MESLNNFGIYSVSDDAKANVYVMDDYGDAVLLNCETFNQAVNFILSDYGFDVI